MIGALSEFCYSRISNEFSQSWFPDASIVYNELYSMHPEVASYILSLGDFRKQPLKFFYVVLHSLEEPWLKKAGAGQATLVTIGELLETWKLRIYLTKTPEWRF